MTLYPQLVPSSRSFDAGDFPVKSYKAQDGYEFRFLYGDKRTGMKLQLVYANIPDAKAALFIDHYQSVKGTYLQFSIGDAGNNPVLEGWSEAKSYLNAALWGNLYRYAEPPKLDSVRPGVSSVQVRLVGALVGGG